MPWPEILFVLNLAGALASVIGIPLALLSIRQARNAARRSVTEAELSKNASLNAEREVQRFRDDIKLLTSVVDFERALHLIDDIKLFVRNSTYQPIPDRISSLVALLNRIRGSSSLFDNEQQILIQESIVELREIEDVVDKANLKLKTPQGISGFNRRLSEQIDRLHPLLTDLRDRIGATS